MTEVTIKLISDGFDTWQSKMIEEHGYTNFPMDQITENKGNIIVK